MMQARIKLHHRLLLLPLLLCTALAAFAPMPSAGEAISEARDSPPFPEITAVVPAQRLPELSDPAALKEWQWLSSHQVLCRKADRSDFFVIDTLTGQQTLLKQSEAAPHQSRSWDCWAINLSPDGRWLLWPSGSAAKPTWVALTLDGQERREWPRTTRVGYASIAWMQDNRHWVEFSANWMKIGQGDAVPGPAVYKVRVYDTASPLITERPLNTEPLEQDFLIASCCTPLPFLFTQDGRAWITYASAQSASPQTAILNAFELLPGQNAWTLRESTVTLGLGTSYACALSPDGNWLVWANHAPGTTGPTRLVLMRSDGSDAHTVFEAPDGELLYYLHWTDDSRGIVFHKGSICYPEWAAWTDGMHFLPLAEEEAKINRQDKQDWVRTAGRYLSGKFPKPARRLLLASRAPSTVRWLHKHSARPMPDPLRRHIVRRRL